MEPRAGTIQPIPVRLRIGVTGHRKLADAARICASVRGILGRLDAALAHTPHDYTVVSPLAEGADQIVARCVLDHQPQPGAGAGARLEVVLPMPREAYARTMEGEEGRRAFEELLARSETPDPPVVSGTESNPFGPVGMHVVSHCDILIAVWDGGEARGEGGTAQIVEHAKSSQRFIYWIHAETGEIGIIHPATEHEEEKAERCAMAPSIALNLDAYNQERAVGQQQVDAGVAAEMDPILVEAAGVGLPVDVLNALKTELWPRFKHFDLLANHYRRLQRITGLSVYVLSFCAVAALGLHCVFAPGMWPVALIELAALILIVALMSAERRLEIHRKWIDYRFLAERMRAGMHLSLVPSRAARPALVDDDARVDWLDVAMRWIGDRLAAAPAFDAPAASIRTFLRSVWIKNQREYYSKKAALYSRDHHRLHMAGVWLFRLALVACVAHIAVGATISMIGRRDSARAAEMQPAAKHKEDDHGGNNHTKAGHGGVLHGAEKVTVILGLLLPALGATLAGIKNFLDDQRIAERYRHMSLRLFLLTSPPEAAGGDEMEALRAEAAEAFQVMMSENADWRVDVAFRKADPA